MRKTNKFQEAATKITADIVQEESTQKQNIEDRPSEEVIKEMLNWQRRYSEVAIVNNRHVEIIEQLIYFLTMQCGILYTAITGELKVDDPLKEISPVLVATFDASQEDLHFFRQGIIIYLKKLTENGEIEEAYQDWLKYINAQED